MASGDREGVGLGPNGFVTRSPRRHGPRPARRERTWLPITLRSAVAEAKAVGATRHDILVAYFHVVRDRVPFHDLGPDWLAARFSIEHRTARLVRQLEALGHSVSLDPVA